MQLSIFTVRELHRSTVVLSLHDLMIRYMLRRYFRSGVTFAGGKVDPYSTADFVIDHDVTHFFIFLVQRALQQDGNYDYPADNLLIYDPELWRKVLAHCAAVAPNTFVAQVHAFIAGYYRGGELRFHDILDYVDWLCVDEPWYQVYSSNSIERLRCIEERRLHTHFTALYDHECLLYYLLISSSCESHRERLERLRTVDPLRDFSASKVRHRMVDDRTTVNVSRLLLQGKLLMPRFNWRALFDSLYDTRVYDNTLSHVFRIVRCFFRYIITKQPFDSTNEIMTSAVASAIDDLMKLRKKRDKKNNGNNGNGGIETQEESSDATLHSPDTSNYTFAVVWEKTDTSKFSVYVEILQKLLNFLNCICLVYNGSFANLGGADNMRVFSVRELQSAVKKQQGVWNKDRILCVYGEIFNSFDVDAFIGSCCRPRVNTFPSKIIGNRFASVPTSDVNLNFLRVASEGVCNQIIWNLCTRRYEIAAPSLLYLLSLDTSNWNITEAESYPNARDPRTAEYTSLILLHMDEFLSVAQRTDALSMMLYSRLISKKRIGDSDGKDVVLTKVASVSSPEEEEAREETATLPCESTEQDDVPHTPSINYVDFVIDRAEFLRLAQHVPTIWIYAFVRHTLQCAPTGDRGSTFFLQMVLLMLQLRRDPQFAATLESGTTFLIKALIDETLESTVPLTWLRKRKRESGGAEPVADKKSFDEVGLQGCMSETLLTTVLCRTLSWCRLRTR